MTIFINEELKKAVIIALNAGLKVWSFQKDKPITQVFFDNGYSFGSCQAYYSGLSFSTCHKPAENIGSGFGFGSNNIETASLENIEKTFILAPNWVGTKDLQLVVKESFGQKRKREKMLNYYQLLGVQNEKI